MRLEALAIEAPQARPCAVPDWTLGCFRRRCITYASGVEDVTTQVIWIQSHGLTGDLRIPADRPAVAQRGGLAGCTREELAALCLAEGGVAETSFADGRMRWARWCAFQPYDKWPEPGELRRVGTCLLEFAPSGIYVEDWRLQPSESRLLVGLRLIEESLEGQPARPRDGGLVIAGDHAILSLGRTLDLESDAPLPEQVRECRDPAALARRIFSAETSYARRRASGDYVVDLSTDPFAAGAALDLAGFRPGEAPDRLVQETRCGDQRLRRTWRIDTLSPEATTETATPAHAAGWDWLNREGAHLAGVEAGASRAI